MKKKSATRRKTHKTHASHIAHAKSLEDTLVQNLVELQKIHTNLLERFNKLSDNISSLLTLFEGAARSFAQHPSIQAADKDKEFLDKIDRLLDQNKTIAKGLTLMEEKMKERVYGQSSQMFASPNTLNPDMQRRPLPR